MATIHITEIQRLLAERGERDAEPFSQGDGYFLEIRFDSPNASGKVEVDPELRNKVLTGICEYGNVVIQFDDAGQLRSVDLS